MHWIDYARSPLDPITIDQTVAKVVAVDDIELVDRSRRVYDGTFSPRTREPRAGAAVADSGVRVDLGEQMGHPARARSDERNGATCAPPSSSITARAVELKCTRLSSATCARSMMKTWR